MPATVFAMPTAPKIDTPGGPSTEESGWVQTNIPANPQFIKQYSTTGLECNFTVDVHPVDQKAVFIAFIIKGVGVDTGWILDNATNAQLGVFTLNDVHTFGGRDQIPAGAYNMSLWMYGSKGTWLDSPDEYLECKEITLPPSQ